jgi:multicomponent Na+:H+ antiporter subunit D
MITAFLAACATKVAIYVLIRFDFFVFQANLPGHHLQFSFLLLPLALLGILVASAVAMFEGNLKRLLATSSVAQIGYIILGASFLTEAGLTASAAHLFNHALAKGGLFLAVACLACHYRDLRLDQLAGAARGMPLTAAAMVVSGFSLIGIPGTAGFISKWLLISAALGEGPYAWVLVAIILASSLMALVYIWRILETLYFRPAMIAPEQPGEAPLPLLGVTLIVALANIGFGLFPQFPLSLSSAAAELLLRHSL